MSLVFAGVCSHAPGITGRKERAALENGDVGLLYVMGVNGQILMHYAALLGQPWDVYIAAMRDGVRKHGPVRAGLYSMLKDRR